ncbi:MAG: S41 family peptidase [Acidobacteriota bacterium]
MSLKGKLAIVVFSAALAFYTIVGGFLSVQKDVFAKGDPYVQLRIFSEVLRHIVRDYVDEPDLEKVRVGALRGLTEGLDPYSAYLTPEQAKKYQPARDDQTGTGMILSKVSGYLYVVAVLKGSPAEKVGFRAGDVIEYINGFATRDISLYDAEEMLSGANGSDIEMKVFRRGRGYKAKIKRSNVAQPTVEASTPETGIGYLRVTSLADGKPEEIKKQLLDLQKKGVQKLVLDLRGAANGHIETGVEVANLFIKTGTLAKTIGHNGAVANTFEADPNKVAFTGPLTLIVDKSTAGASEVIAAAVAANKRGELVGERTFGAGAEQKLFQLKSGAALLLTVIKYADPAGSPFIKENPGVAATVEVKSSAANEDVLPEDDDQGAADGQNQEENDPALPVETPASEDLQLKKAVELLKGSQSQEKRVAQNEASSSNVTISIPQHSRALRAGGRL